MRRNSSLLLILFGAGLLYIASCTKENDENRTKIKFALDLNVDGEALEFGRTYQVN